MSKIPRYSRIKGGYKCPFQHDDGQPVVGTYWNNLFNHLVGPKGHGLSQQDAHTVVGLVSVGAPVPPRNTFKS